MVLFYPVAVFADMFVSNSGRIFRDYHVNRISAHKIQIIHMEGSTWLAHSELPAELLKKYSDAIEEAKSKQRKREQDDAKKKIAAALKNKTAQEAIDALSKLKDKSPSGVNVNEIDHWIKQKEIEKKWHAIPADISAAKKIVMLQALLDEKTDTALRGKIEQHINVLKQMLQKKEAVIEAEIQFALLAEDNEHTILYLKKILEKYPEFPFPDRQDAYILRVKQLIEKYETIIQDLQVRIAEKVKLYQQNNSGMEDRLLEMFLQKPVIGEEISKVILPESAKLAAAIKFVFDVNDPYKAKEKLQKCLADCPNALNKRAAMNFLKHLDEEIKSKRRW